MREARTTRELVYSSYLNLGFSISIIMMGRLAHICTLIKMDDEDRVTDKTRNGGDQRPKRNGDHPIKNVTEGNTMVLWEITLGTAYFLGLRRTYRLALKIQRRVVGPKHPKIRQFLHR